MIVLQSSIVGRLFMLLPRCIGSLEQLPAVDGCQRAIKISLRKVKKDNL